MACYQYQYMIVHQKNYQYMILVLSVILSYGIIYLTEASLGGISVELIHRDSPKSPLYNPNETRIQRLTNAYHRSFRRYNRFYPQQLDSTYPKSEISDLDGEYVMKFSIGSYNLDVVGIVDTGSDLVWLQCQPCQCYEQNRAIFNSSESSSYVNVLCSDEICQFINPTCSPGKSICQYNISYGDGSMSNGDVAFETFTLGTNDSITYFSIPHVLIGCSRFHRGYYNPDISGVVGLGKGILSLNNQLSDTFRRKFSYCLVPDLDPDATSTLNFGENAVVSGPGTLITPFQSGPVSTFYYLTLEGITVGNKTLDYVAAPGSGNIIIDSGSKWTVLPEELYTKLESEVASQLKLRNLDPAPSPSPEIKLCYVSNSTVSTIIKGLIIEAHFTGADVVLTSVNTFFNANELSCLAFTPATSGGAIYGHMAQWNFVVGYDGEKNTVSFKSTDCTRPLSSITNSYKATSPSILLIGMLMLALDVYLF